MAITKETVVKTLKELKENSPKRKFNQRYDLIITLRDLNLKKPDDQVDQFVLLHFSHGKTQKICAFVGPELKEDATKICDTMLMVNDFEKYKDKKITKRLASDHGFFIAQANIMPKVAQTFGKILGTRGKMPNPKAGCVVPPKTNLQALYDRLQKTVRLVAKTQMAVKCPVGAQDMKDEEVADNVMTIYNALTHNLPKEDKNVKEVLLKMTMSRPMRVA